jgi:hypothetical protein
MYFDQERLRSNKGSLQMTWFRMWLVNTPIRNCVINLIQTVATC